MRVFHQLILCVFISFLLCACSWMKGLVGLDEKTVPVVKEKIVDPVVVAETPVCAQLSAEECNAGGEKLLAKNNSQTDAMALAFFVQACDKLNAEACQQSGVMYQKGQGVGQDFVQAVARFSAACQIDKKSGCYEAALAYREGGLVKQDLIIAADYFELACNNAPVSDKSKSKSCTQKGLLLLAESQKDKAAVQLVYEAFEYFLKGCKAGDGEGCFQAASAYLSGKGVAGSDVYAKQYYVLGCNVKNGESCLWAGHLNSLSSPLDATDYYYTGCSYNNEEACFELAERYRLGKAITKNSQLAKITYQQVCYEKMPIACYWFSNLLQQQIELSGVAATTEEAKNIVDSYKIACDVYLTLACYQLAEITKKAEWVASDPPAVAQYLEPYCNEKEWFGCYDLAKLYQVGEGVVAQPQKSADMFKQVCDADVKTPIILELVAEAEQIALQKKWQVHACWLLAEMLWQYPTIESKDVDKDGNTDSLISDVSDAPKVIPLMKDNKTALVYYDKACKLDWLPACLIYAMNLDKGIVIDSDPLLALQYYTKACALDEFDLGVGVVSTLPETSQSGEKNSNKEFDYKLKQQSMATGCYNLAVNFRDGIGTGKSIANANYLFKRSCQLEQSWGCYNYAVSGSESDLSTSYFRQSCQLGYAKACSLTGDNQQYLSKPTMGKQTQLVK